MTFNPVSRAGNVYRIKILIEIINFKIIINTSFPFSINSRNLFDFFFFFGFPPTREEIERIKIYYEQNVETKVEIFDVPCG